ncbi:DUF2269 family protein [Patulibacter defluvii]|uniref:DUF2269 family protein n=1 Tax=Patulibacter defluvii TaxID=3095358 RepID=UPI002A75DDC5|nr:DUF2269 family protein [Patulibacter sp. DM4]
MLALVTAYTVAKAIHIIGVVFAFGATIVTPPIGAYLQRHQPQALGAFHGAIAQLGRTVVTPGMTIVLIAGLYMAADASAFSEPWVSASLLILFVLFGLYGALIIPRSEELSKRAAAVEGDPTGDPQYAATAALVARLHLIAITLVVVAVLVMTLKPGS